MVSDFHRWSTPHQCVVASLMLSKRALKCTTVYRKSRGTMNIDRRMDLDVPLERATQTLKLTDHYIALLVLIFTKAGLLDVCSSLHLLDILILILLSVGPHLHAGGINNGLQSFPQSHLADGGSFANG